MKNSLEAYCETGYSVPFMHDNYTVQKFGRRWHVVNPSGVVIGEGTRYADCVKYANSQNISNGLPTIGLPTI